MDNLRKSVIWSGWLKWNSITPWIFEIITLSNCDFGDVDFNQTLNISDIILIIENIISDITFTTEHQNLLADINQDNTTNISDIIILIEEILN